MKTTFNYDYEAAKELCFEYSDDKKTLGKLIKRLNICVGPPTVIPSPWNEDLKALHMIVTIGKLSFAYHGSHVDAMTQTPAVDRWDRSDIRKRKKASKAFKDGLLYSILCSIRSDYYILYEDMEDLGYNPDSIKDVANWNKAKEHAQKLRSELNLTEEELQSLPS